MDPMINTALIKTLRNERAWSQEQLAAISGLSHRTIQRIENEGSCSLESKKALAAAFDMEAEGLDIDTTKITTQKQTIKGVKLAFLAVVLGMLCAYTGITHSLINHHISSGQAGLYYGGIAAFCGICSGLIGILSNRLQSSSLQ
ncbi:helix-turn-helix transcriptional regulator [Oceanicoccus sagamiensis]|uniref:Transcriptional regulator n=1 Tax=Oceanicoccus sagamiensis TaxID=716816 RepID=A0A1X9NAA7_9GAMM|nr:helix-turn-helix transcriptional regulator [Oceanicoccus sagamiensis]ARN73362.1 transcriptional regulator [Oceanicoccus sagamiensis]